MWRDYGHNHRHTFLKVWYRHSWYDILTKNSFNYHLRSNYVNANQLSHLTAHNCMLLLFIVKLSSFHGNTLLVFMLSCRCRQRAEFTTSYHRWTFPVCGFNYSSPTYFEDGIYIRKGSMLTLFIDFDMSTPATTPIYTISDVLTQLREIKHELWIVYFTCAITDCL